MELRSISGVMQKEINRMISDFTSWVRELSDLSDIPQDGDARFSSEQGECRFNRLIELIDAVEDGAGKNVAIALLHVIKDQDDYGAYESILGALYYKIDRALFVEVLIEELPSLIQRNGEMAEVIVGDLSNIRSDDHINNRTLWTQALGQASTDTQTVIRDFIDERFDA